MKCVICNEAHTSIIVSSGGEELSLPQQQKHGICLMGKFLIDSLNSSCVHVCLLHCSLGGNDLTATGALALATALEHNKSLEELK